MIRNRWNQNGMNIGSTINFSVANLMEENPTQWLFPLPRSQACSTWGTCSIIPYKIFLCAAQEWKERTLAGFRAPTMPLSRQKLKRSEEHTSELQSRQYLVCRLLLEKKKKQHSKKCSGI